MVGTRGGEEGDGGEVCGLCPPRPVQGGAAGVQAVERGWGVRCGCGPVCVCVCVRAGRCAVRPGARTASEPDTV